MTPELKWIIGIVIIAAIVIVIIIILAVTLSSKKTDSGTSGADTTSSTSGTDTSGKDTSGAGTGGTGTKGSIGGSGESTDDTALQTELDKSYGLFSTNPNLCPYGPCAYGSVGMQASSCRAIGGTMDSTPNADTDWIGCNLNVGLKDTTGTHPFYGFRPAHSCPSGCQYGYFTTTGGSCRAIGGAMNGTPGDSEMTSCHMDIGPSPTWTLYPADTCPTGTCYPARFNTRADQCIALGGVADGTGQQIGLCTFNLGAANAPPTTQHTAVL